MKIRKQGSGRKAKSPELKKHQFSVYIPKFILDQLQDEEKVKDAIRGIIAESAGFNYNSEHQIFTTKTN